MAGAHHNVGASPAYYTDPGSINIDMVLPEVKEDYTKTFLGRMRQATWNHGSLEVSLNTQLQDSILQRVALNRPGTVGCSVMRCFVYIVQMLGPLCTAPSTKPPGQPKSGL